jgi:tetratricopeptide (TPR) repeat protein
MPRWPAFFFCLTLLAQAPIKKQEEQAPPEEDAALAPKQYAFNPLQAEKEMKAGDFYFKKGKYRAAGNRYLEATRWNNNLAEAYLKLGEAEEKEHDKRAAKEAYQRYLALAPDARNAAEIKKKLAKL